MIATILLNSDILIYRRKSLLLENVQMYIRIFPLSLRSC